MLISMFKDGVNINDFYNYIRLQKAHCEELGIPLKDYFLIEDLSDDTVKYYYYYTHSENMINKVYLTYTNSPSSKFGLACFDLKYSEINILTSCEYDFIEPICDNTFVLKSVLGKSCIVVKDTLCYMNIHSYDAYQIGGKFFIVYVYDEKLNFHLLTFLDSDDVYKEHKTIDSFSKSFDSSFMLLNSQRCLDEYSIGELNEFKDSIILDMLHNNFK